MLRTFVQLTLICTLAVVSGFGWSAAANGAGIPSLYNTGVDAFHAPIPLYANDQNYDLIVSADPTCPVGVDPVMLDLPGIWVNTNNAISGWIRPAYLEPTGAPNPFLAGNCVNGTYVYRTTFTLSTPSEVSTASITGRYASDDQSVNIKLNGNIVPAPLANFVSYVPFTVPTGSPFVLGTNTLDFELQNLGGPPTGLRVEMVGVPEPSTLGLLTAAGVAALLGVRRRRRV